MSATATAIVGTSLRGMRSMLGLQLASRGLTFILNTLITRYVDKQVFSIANLHAQLLMNIILFLSREAFRRACQRAEISKGNAALNIQKISNIAWLSVPFGFVVSLLVALGFLWSSTDEEMSVVGYKETVWLIAFASMLELVAEPPFILAQNLLWFNVRVAIEATAVLLRCILIYFLITYTGIGLIAFGIGQIVFSLVLIVGYYGYFLHAIRQRIHPALQSSSQLLPRSIGPSFLQSFDRSLLRFAQSYLWQVVQSLVLQEGEKIVLRNVASLVNQSIYGVVNVLGSLLTRIVFLPIEEAAGPLFSSLVGKDSQSTSKENISLAHTMITSLIRVLSLVGLVIVCFGPSYSFLLLHLLYTEKYSATAAPTVLSWYCLYVFAMALNGITEAFCRAVATPNQLAKLNLLMIGQSAVFVASAIVLVRSMETSGLVIANCITMGLRIVASLVFITRFFKNCGERLHAKEEAPSFSLKHAFPSSALVIILVLCACVTRLSEAEYCSRTTGFSWLGCTKHVSVGVLCILVFLLFLWKLERDVILRLKSFFSKK